WGAAAGLVVVSGKKARLVRQCENALDALPEAMCITSRKIGPGGAAIRHEQRVMDEGRAADHIGDGGKGVAGREQDRALELAELECLTVGEEVVPWRAVCGKAVREVVERLPEALDVDHTFADCGRRPRYILQVACCREVVRVRVRIQDPVDREVSLPDIVQNGIRRSCRRRARLLVEVQ